VCFDFAEVCADACVAADFEGVGDGKEHVAVDVVSVSGWAVQVALYETEGARTVCKEVGMSELEADVAGRSLAEERLGEAAVILRISRRRKALYGGYFWKVM
jgi:hypothetical protein